MTAKTSLLPDHSTYEHLGLYKCPLLYYCLCQSWVNKEKASGAGLSLDGRILVLDGHQFYVESDWEEVRNKTHEAIEKRDPSFFNFIAKTISDDIGRVISLSSDLRESKPTTKKFETFLSAVHDMEFAWYMLLPSGDVLEEVIKKEIADLELPAESIEAFSQLKRETLLSKLKDEARILAVELKNLGVLDTSLSQAPSEALQAIEAQSPQVFQKILSHVERNRWFGMMHFWGTPYTPQIALAQILAASKEKLQSAESHPWNASEKLTWLRDMLAEVSYWRQHVAEACAIASEAIYTAIGQGGFGFTFAQAQWMTPEELLRALADGAAPSDETLNERKRGYGMFAEGGSVRVVVGEELKALLAVYVTKVERVSEFRGMVASRGVVRGTVKVLTSPEQINKIERGDILVAPETTPDFVPAMQKAAGIVTDMGGITSHAAIVSREYRIPCVVGTKIATSVLQDGDLIELDGERGIIKKLS